MAEGEEYEAADVLFMTFVEKGGNPSIIRHEIYPETERAEKTIRAGARKGFSALVDAKVRSCSSECSRKRSRTSG